MVNIPQNCPLVYVSFSAEIYTTQIEKLLEIMAVCSNQNVKSVYLLISTPGGMVREGLNLYNILRGMPFELITHNVGTISSVGNPIFLAGNPRYACSSSTFMFHGVGFNWKVNERLEQKNLEEKLSSLLSDQKRIGNIITKNTKINNEEIKELFRQAITKDAQYALDKGIVHEIRDVKIQKGCPMLSLVFNRK